MNTQAYIHTLQGNVGLQCYGHINGFSYEESPESNLSLIERSTRTSE